jgi:hypothetical protein
MIKETSPNRRSPFVWLPEIRFLDRLAIAVQDRLALRIFVAISGATFEHTLDVIDIFLSLLADAHSSGFRNVARVPTALAQAHTLHQVRIRAHDDQCILRACGFR